jgi:RNA polymerase sigma-70 factor (ECF subfamily)
MPKFMYVFRGGGYASSEPISWAALADLARRAGRIAEARELYHRAAGLAGSRAERRSYERRLDQLAS